MTKITTVFTAFTGFLGKYAQETAAIGAALEAVVSTIPMQAGDKANILAKISELAAIGPSITDFINHVVEPTPVQISASDINDAVNAYLSSPTGLALIAEVVKEYTPAPPTPPTPVFMDTTKSGTDGAA
jgi:hypothetical protein